MPRSLGVLLVLAAGSPLAMAQSVAGGFGADVFGSGQVVDAAVWGGARPATADFNEDGRADLLTADGDLADLVRFLGQASGGVGDRLVLPVLDQGHDFLQPLAGDFNGDGHADALAYATLSGAVNLLAGHGDGSFGAATEAVFLPSSLDSLAVGDVDDDGVLDLVWAAGFTGPHSIFWSPGLGTGLFAAPGRVGDAALPKSLIVGDLDGDGLPDIAALSDSQVVVFPAVSPGAFGAPESFSSFAAGSLAAADMDRDGHVDLVHTGTADAITILHGDGLGGFGDALHVSLGDGIVWNVLPADVDRDGLPDLLGTGEFPTSLRGRRMAPDGPIGLPQGFALQAGPAITGAVAADFDGDGLIDAATTAFSSGQLLVSTNALGPFVDFGFAVASAQGTPKIELFGVPAAGQPVSAQIVPTAVPILGLVVVGLHAQDTPFLGSLFVPSADASFLVTVPGTSFDGLWPAGFPPATPIYLQAVFALQGGGKTISNAVMILSE